MATVVEGRTEAVSEAEELVSLDPGSGAEVGRFPVHSRAEVEAAVRRARDAARWWGELGFDGRRRRLLRVAGLIARGSTRSSS